MRATASMALTRFSSSSLSLLNLSPSAITIWSRSISFWFSTISFWRREVSGLEEPPDAADEHHQGREENAEEDAQVEGRNLEGVALLYSGRGEIES